jgi:hypothetical protein
MGQRELKERVGNEPIRWTNPENRAWNLFQALGFTLEFKPASVHQTRANSKRLPKS